MPKKTYHVVVREATVRYAHVEVLAESEAEAIKNALAAQRKGLNHSFLAEHESGMRADVLGEIPETVSVRVMQ